MSSSRSLISSLTTNDANVPSAYGMKQLAIFTKNRSECPGVWLLLMQKLQSAPPPSKLKAMRVIKYLLENGAPDFRIVVRRDSSQIIRAMITYKGPISQLTGDAVNQKVRDAAKETWNVLNSNLTQTAYNQPDPSLQGRIQGYGGNGNGGQPSAPVNRANAVIQNSGRPTQAPPTGKYQGYGNPNFQNDFRDEKPTLKQKVLNRVEKYVREQERKKNRGKAPQGLYESSMANTLSQGGPQAQWEGKQRQKHSVGGGWGDDNATTYSLPTSNNNNNNAQNFGNSSLQQDDNHEQAHYSSQPQQVYEEETPRSDGVYERGLIEKVTQASGIRGTLTPQELNSFVAKCRSLDLICVSDILDERLTESSATVLNKTLAIVEALLGQGWAESVDDHFRSHYDNVQQCTSSRNAAVRKKAQKILGLLGVADDTNSSNGHQQPQQQQQQTSIIEGLDFGGGDASGGEASAFGFVDETPAAAAPVTGMEALFGDMSVSAAPSSSSTNNASADSSGLSALMGGFTENPKTDVMALFDAPAPAQQQANTAAHDVFFGGNPASMGNSNSRANALNDPLFDQAMFGGGNASLGMQQQQFGQFSNNQQMPNNSIDAFFTAPKPSSKPDTSFMAASNNTGIPANNSKKSVNDAFSFITLQ